MPADHSQIELVPAHTDQQTATAIFPLFQAYQAELGVDTGYRYFPLYWSESTRFPYLIMEQETMAGFVLIRQLDDLPTFQIAEFYVKPECRRSHIGRTVASQLFGLHPGNWEAQVLADNAAAKSFWRSVFGEASGMKLSSGDFKFTRKYP